MGSVTWWCHAANVPDKETKADLVALQVKQNHSQAYKWTIMTGTTRSLLCRLPLEAVFCRGAAQSPAFSRNISPAPTLNLPNEGSFLLNWWKLLNPFICSLAVCPCWKLSDSCAEFWSGCLLLAEIYCLALPQRLFSLFLLHRLHYLRGCLGKLYPINSIVVFPVSGSSGDLFAGEKVLRKIIFTSCVL